MRSALAFADSVNYACAPRIIDVADWWRAPSPSLSLHLSVIRPLGSILFKLICFRCRFYILLSIARAIKKENNASWPMGYYFHRSFNTSQRLNTLNKINFMYKTALIQTTIFLLNVAVCFSLPPSIHVWRLCVSNPGLQTSRRCRWSSSVEHNFQQQLVWRRCNLLSLQINNLQNTIGRFLQLIHKLFKYL